MNDESQFRILDAARACGLEPAQLRSWLEREGADVSPRAGGLISRRELEACLRRRDLALPADLFPWPKILVVDDQPDAARLARWTLEEALPFAVVRCAGSGAAALDQLADFRPDLVVTDLHMPDGIDGFALCERVAADRSLFGTKVVVLSGDAAPESWDRAFERGAAEFLRKPAGAGRLAGAARRLLGIPDPAALA